MITSKRRSFWLGTAAVLGIAALNVSVARAQEEAPQPPPPGQAPGGQRPGRGGGRQGGMQNPAMLVANAFAATKPTADQDAKFKALQTKMMADMRGMRGQGTDPAEGRAKMQAAQTKYIDDTKALLTDDQKKIFDTEMAKAPRPGGGGIMMQLDSLALTPEEKTKIEPLVADAQKQIMDLPQADRRTKTPEIMTDLKAKIRPLLTADQQTKLDGLTLRAGGGRGGAGGGRRGGAGGPGGAPPPPPLPPPRKRVRRKSTKSRGTIHGFFVLSGTFGLW